MSNYNGKPIITGNVPWYRHHLFPWGWYQLNRLPLKVGDIYSTDGDYTVGDGGDNRYEVIAAGTGTADGGSLIDLPTKQAKALFPSSDAITFGDVISNNQKEK